MTNTNNDIYNRKKLALLDGLPDYCADFVKAKEEIWSANTQMNYIMDLHPFFTWLKEYTAYEKNIKEISAELINNLSQADIQEYLNYLSEYRGPDGTIRKNAERVKARKLSSLRGLCGFMIRRGLINNDPTYEVRNPKFTPKEFTTIDEFDQDAILKAIDSGIGKSGDKMQGVQLAFNIRNQTRNAAIISLMLETGISTIEISELNCEDLHIDEGYIAIQANLPEAIEITLTKPTLDRLKLYLVDRDTIYNPPADEHALFISKKNKRLSKRSIQYMIRSYMDFAIESAENKKIARYARFK